MSVINFLNEKIIWGIPMLILFIAVGLFFSFKLKFFQFNIIKILKETLFSKKKSGGENSLSPFQTLTSTLAVTLGTGNIVALGTAIAFGGAGAVFWMWVSAFLGMATTYAENYLGIKYRRKNPDGSYTGGVFFYIEKALGHKWAAIFAFCCIMASLGMGNMTQINALSTSMKGSFETPLWVSGLVSALIVGILIFGGAIFFGQVTEKVIPIISLVYILGCIAVIAVNIEFVPSMLERIISEAFDFRAIGGGILGSVMLKGISWGFRRGIFSNEAGLGSTVMLSSMSSEQNPQKQGFWATLTVFFDTIIVCSLTAFAVLLTGADKMGIDGTALTSAAFESAFGHYADMFVTVSICLFALATVAGWSVFGVISTRYLFGEGCVKPFMIIFIICCFLGAVLNLEMIWGIADIFNGLMAVPNLLSLLILRKEMQE